ncbi:hypothetical protein [Nocardioides montaniterrae]
MTSYDAAAPVVPSPTWFPRLPHHEIDSLIDRLNSCAAVDPADVLRLVRLVTREIDNLRSTTHRLVAERLLRAQEQAARIVAEAELTASGVRASANAE